MPQAKTKPVILLHLATERRRLEDNLSGFSADELLLPGILGAWSMKDVLAHLAHWEELFFTWLDTARRGERVESPLPGITWKQLDKLNDIIYARHKDQSLSEVLEYFHAIHTRFMALVEAMPEDEMLTPAYYSFTGKGAIYNWLSAYAAHDRWAKTHLRKWIKERSS